MTAVLGASRVGVRLSPWNGFNDMFDSEGEALWNYLAAELDKRELAYLHVVEPRSDFTTDLPVNANAPDAAGHFKAIFKGSLISTGGYVAERRAPLWPIRGPMPSDSGVFSLAILICLSGFASAQR